jgi:hypothetical protein
VWIIHQINHCFSWQKLTSAHRIHVWTEAIVFRQVQPEPSVNACQGLQALFANSQTRVTAIPVWMMQPAIQFSVRWLHTVAAVLKASKDPTVRSTSAIGAPHNHATTGVYAVLIKSLRNHTAHVPYFSQVTSLIWQVFFYFNAFWVCYNKMR